MYLQNLFQSLTLDFDICALKTIFFFIFLKILNDVKKFFFANKNFIENFKGFNPLRQICFGSNTPSAYKQLAQIFRSEGKNRKALRMYATYEVMFSFLRVQNAVEHASHS